MGFTGERAERWDAQHRGYVPVDQLWVEPSAGVLTVGLTWHVRQLLGGRITADVGLGDRLERSDAMVVRGSDGVLRLPVPASGVTRVRIPTGARDWYG